MWKAGARAGALGVRGLRGQEQRRLPRPRRAAAGRGESRAGTLPKRGPMSASAPAARPLIAARRACVFDAGPPRRRTAGSPASRVWRSGAPRTAPITLPGKPPASLTAAPASTRNEGAAGPGASGFRNSGSRRGSVSAAAGTLPPKGGPPARRAARSARRRNAGSMPNAGPPASAPAAAARSMTACRAAPPAPRSRTPPSARTGRT